MERARLVVSICVQTILMSTFVPLVTVCYLMIVQCKPLYLSLQSLVADGVIVSFFTLPPEHLMFSLPTC